MNKKIKMALAALVLTVTTGMGANAMSDPSPDFVAVANIDMANKTITRHEARLIFTLKTRYWPNGDKITIIHLPFYHKDHRAFVKNVLNMQPSTYSKFVDILINSGGSSSFYEVANPAEMITVVQRKTGAIGYVSNDYLLINGVGHVDVIKIVD